MILRKLSGIPLGNEQHVGQIIPFSMVWANYVALNHTYQVVFDRVPVEKALDEGSLVFRMCNGRTFIARPRFDGYESDGWKLFTFEGFDQDIYIIDIDHHDEKVFGYNVAENKFFRVKIYLLEHDARFTLDKKSYYLSTFMK